MVSTGTLNTVIKLLPTYEVEFLRRLHLAPVITFVVLIFPEEDNPLWRSRSNRHIRAYFSHGSPFSGLHKLPPSTYYKYGKR